MARALARTAGRLVSPMLPLAAALGLWAPLLDNFFHADDFLHLFDIATLSTWQFVTQLWGGHLYLVRNAAFVAMFDAFGPDPRAFFLTVLVTQGVNTLLLHRVIRHFTGDRFLAGGGALLWTTCPALEGALGWYSVYGQVLLTTLVLGVLANLGGLLARGGELSAWHAAVWAALLAAGGACFGMGLGIAPVFPVAVALVVPPARRSRRAVLVLAFAAAAILTVYVLMRAQAPAPDQRARALLSLGTTAHALPTGIALAVHLLTFGATALLATLRGPQGGYPDAATVLPGALVAAVVVAGWLAASPFGRRRLGALALLVVAAYGATGVGRAAPVVFFGSPIAAATWPRYHYFPLALLAVLLCAAMVALRERSRTAGRVVQAIGAFCLAARLVVLAVHPLAIDQHAADRAFTGETLAQIADAVPATPPGQTALIESRPFPPMVLVLHITRAFFPGSAGAFAIFVPGNTLAGRPVRFLVSDTDWALAQARGGRIAALVERRDAAAPVTRDSRAP